MMVQYAVIAAVQAALENDYPGSADGDGLPARRAPIFVSDVLRAVCIHFGVSRLDMVSERRTRNLARPRWVAMYLARELTPRSLPMIGRIIGDRHHTTVLHGYREMAALIAAGDPIAADVEAIRARLLA